MTHHRFLDACAEVCGANHVLSDAADLAPYVTDWRGRYRGEALAVIRPGSTAEVSAIVRLGREAGVAIVPQGGNTGMCAGATPMARPREAIILRLDRMNRIRAISPLGDSIAVDAGCILQNVQEAAQAEGRLFPLSLGAEGSCQIGGNISTNAGGTAALRYGTMRDLVLGLEVVLPDGQVLDLMTALRKDSAGYELKHLFIGAEGTLGVITGAVLKLFPRPSHRAVALAKLSSIGAVLQLLALARTLAGDRIGAFEVMNQGQIEVIAENLPHIGIPFSVDAPWYVLIELSDMGEEQALQGVLERLLEQAFEADLVRDALVASSEAQAQAFWKIRHSVSEGSKAAGYVVSHDSVVPLAEQGRFVTEVERRVRALRPDARIGMHGHIGDGNIHFLAIIPHVADETARYAQIDAINAIVDDVTRDLRGSISAEHGIGYANVGRLARFAPPLELELMRTIKKAFDPEGLFNPGKLFAG
jgi:FAD/FMN-containing dehydrogenase